ncbi:CARDB domain-containing protein [Oligoflexus tunisiensis]|uniref:CARDB domain-containing protein n=1 Tax=Oligoflexus tunisiensis TaxID=708132 RepID=UPI00114CBA3D|nr:CARDB domain-containing protein [Oligoflexus tunisiensis]
MKKLLKILSTAALLATITACGVQDDEASTVSSVAAPNLKASAPQFRCGQGVVVIQVTNVGNANAGSSFIRIDQSNAPSQAFFVKALKAGESQRIGITAKYKAGKLDATIQADSTKTVAESNERDNVLRLVCEG